jgi:hypothetical protein
MEVQPSRVRQDVPLPADHHDGEAAAQQQRVTVELRARRRRAALCVEVEHAHRHAPAVHDVDERHAAAVRPVDGSQQDELCPRLHFSSRVAWRTREIHDLPVVRVRRIEREEDASHETLVRPSVPERRSAGDGFASVDDDSHDARERNARDPGEERDRRYR